MDVHFCLQCTRWTILGLCTAHPTLNRHSPPEVVANFKRRVPPRLPKPRKRDPEVPPIPPPRSAIGTGHIPIPMSAGDLSPYKGGRTRGFSAPGSFTPLGQPGATGLCSTLPPLNVPSEPLPVSHSGGLYSHSSHTLHSVTQTEDTQSSGFGSTAYSSADQDVLSPSSQYQYLDQKSSWSFTGASNAQLLQLFVEFAQPQQQRVFQHLPVAIVRD